MSGLWWRAVGHSSFWILQYGQLWSKQSKCCCKCDQANTTACPKSGVTLQMLRNTNNPSLARQAQSHLRQQKRLITKNQFSKCGEMLRPHTKPWVLLRELHWRSQSSWEVCQLAINIRLLPLLIHRVNETRLISCCCTGYSTTCIPAYN